MSWYYLAGSVYVFGVIGTYMHIVLASCTRKIDSFFDSVHILLWPISIPISGLFTCVMYTYYLVRKTLR
jgi:hypothetical protein